MSKFPKIESSLLDTVAKAVEACWNDGSPVAGQSADRWQAIAQVAIRRARSFDRRGISGDDHQSQVCDIAQGFVAAFEPNSDFVGPLIVDYEYVAQKALDAIRRCEAGAA